MNKISSLGKILFFIFIPIMIFANVTANVDKIAVIKGDSATYTITASGDDIEFPKLSNIEGHPVIGTSTSTSISIINGNMQKVKKVSYTFTPKYTFTIPNYSIIVDGKEQQTEPIKIVVKQPTASTPNDDVQLILKVDKNEAYVGEAIKTTILFKYKVGLNIIDINLEDFKINHFWIKSLEQSKPYEENGFVVIKQDYLLFPQLAGDYTIDKQLINVATREYRTNLTRWQKVFSKELKLKIKPLPQNLSIQGDYTISASVDKLQTKANEPVNLTITIKGSGNIDDIEEFKLDMQNEVVYSTKPKIDTYIKGGKYSGKFTQKISIIGDKDFTIPSIEFKYFDIKNKTVKTIKTKPFDIKVKGGAKTVTPNIQTNQNNTEVKTIQVAPKIVYKYKTEDSYIKYIFAFVGLIVGILVTYFALKKSSKKQDTRELAIKIKKAKNDKELYNILLPYSHNNKIVNIIKKLEENIYNKASNKINKDELYDIVEDYDLK